MLAKAICQALVEEDDDLSDDEYADSEEVEVAAPAEEQDPADEEDLDMDDDVPLDQLERVRREREEDERPIADLVNDRAEIEEEEVHERFPELRDLMKRIRGCGYDRCVQEIDDYDKEVRRQLGQEVYTTLKKLHENLGHPTRQRLSQHLQIAGHDDEYVAGAMLMVCKTCLQYRPPNPPPPSTLKKSLRFNETLCVDGFSWHDDDITHHVVMMIDEATKFTQARIIKNQYTSKLVTQMIVEGWISWAGRPDKIRVDEDGPHTSEDLLLWMDQWAIQPEVVAGERSWAMGVIGRHQQMFREMLVKTRESTQMSVHDVLFWCLCAKNEMMMNAGYSPNQWVLGRQTMMFNPLSRDHIRLPELGDNDEVGTRFTDMMMMRKEAAMSLIAVEFDERIKRAIRRRPNPFQRLPVVGDRVYYWRQHGTTKMKGRAQRAGRWRGPAVVVAIEPGEDIRPRTVWIVHATTLLRCALEHLRPDYDTPYQDDGIETFDDVDDILKRAHRTGSRYDDLISQPFPEDEGDDIDLDQPDYDDHDFEDEDPDDNPSDTPHDDDNDDYPAKKKLIWINLTMTIMILKMTIRMIIQVILLMMMITMITPPRRN